MWIVTKNIHLNRCAIRAIGFAQVCSSTHKALLVMVLSRILQWWWLDVSSGFRLSDAGVRRRPLGTVVVENPRDHFIFLNLLEFYLYIQDNHFIPFCLLVSTMLIIVTGFSINEICGCSQFFCVAKSKYGIQAINCILFYNPCASLNMKYKEISMRLTNF
jgi:hypothetical protein